MEVTTERASVADGAGATDGNARMRARIYHKPDGQMFPALSAIRHDAKRLCGNSSPTPSEIGNGVEPCQGRRRRPYGGNWDTGAALPPALRGNKQILKRQ